MRAQSMVKTLLHHKDSRENRGRDLLLCYVIFQENSASAKRVITNTVFMVANGYLLSVMSMLDAVWGKV